MELAAALEQRNPLPDAAQHLEEVEGCWRLLFSTITILVRLTWHWMFAVSLVDLAMHNQQGPHIAAQSASTSAQGRPVASAALPSLDAALTALY